MKNSIKQMLLPFFSLFILCQISLVSADTASDTEKLLNWAENTYPAIFPSHQSTKNIAPWLYRYYSETGVYAGVNTSDNIVYVLGGPWGNESPTQIDTLSSLIVHIDSTGGNGNIAACNLANMPSGMVITQNGNVVNITTNGQCIFQDFSDSDFCDFSEQPAATGISLLQTTIITSSELKGISVDDPSALELFGNEIDGNLNTKKCILNAPTEAVNLIVNMNICFDISSTYQSFPSIPGVTINLPVTYSFGGTSTYTTVSNCFETDADNIEDNFTDDEWTNDGEGGFVNVLG